MKEPLGLVAALLGTAVVIAQWREIRRARRSSAGRKKEPELD